MTLLGLMFMACFSTRGAQAAVYYVTPGGSGTSCSLAAPCGTIQVGIGKLSAGDTLYLRAGTYNERIDVANYHIPAGTSWTNAVTIAGYPGETATITQGINIQDNTDQDSSIVAYMSFENLTIQQPAGESAIVFRVGGNSHHIRLSNSDISQGSGGIWITQTTDSVEILHNTIHDIPAVFAPEYGISVGGYGSYANGTNMLYDGNTFRNNSGYAIHAYHSGGSVNNVVIRNNAFVNCGFDDGQRNLTLGVVIMSGSNNKFYNNILYNNNTNHTGAVVSVSTGSDNTIYNNTIYNNSGPAVEVNANAPNTEIRNNILFNNLTAIADWGASGTVQSNNLMTNPSFADAVTGDFTLRADSPAIDAGLHLDVVTTDIRGLSRLTKAAYDIGAYMFGGTAGRVPLPRPTALRVLGLAP
jgi:hypothetical protein